MDVEASPEVGAASEASALTPQAATEILEAPQGWHKKVVPRIGGTPKPRDVVFVAPNGEEMRSKRQLKRYLKANAGAPPLSDFDWSTGETPRRSERLSTKTRKSVDSPNTAPPAKRAKKKTPAKKPKEDEEDTEVNPLEEGTPMKEEDDEMLDTNLSGEAMPPMESKENKEIDAEFCEVNESGNTEINEHSEVPALVRYSEGEETERKEFEEAVPVEDKETESKTFVEPSPVKYSKDDEIKENELSKHGLVDDSKNEENVETTETKKESNLLETTKEDADAEMQDPAPVTDDCYEEVVIKEEITLIVESTVEVIEAAKGVHRLEQTIESELPTGEKAASEDLESGENKKDVIKDGEQDATNASFSALEIPGQDEHVEKNCTESDHAKPGITSYLNVTKPQEARPAEVGVSS